MMALASVAAALISCSKEVATPEVIEQDEIQVSIQAGSPVTKTMIDGSTPYWCDGDAIGVSKQTDAKNAQFNENSIGAGLTAETATFNGTVTSTGTYYAYYPYTNNGVGTKGAKVDIPLTQHPTPTSFDGAADVMVSKSFTISTTEATTINDLEFARLGAIVKVVLIDNAPSYDLSSEEPSSVSITAPENIVGRVYVDMVNQELGELYYAGSKTVTAEYSSDKFAINGTNGAYFVVYPQTLAAGETLTISAFTDNYEISKDITIPAGGIVFEGGSVTVLKISLADGNIAAVSAGAALPFDDDMAWADNGGSDDGTDLVSTISTESSGLYIAASKAYKGIGGLKLGTSSLAGYVTTKELDLSDAFYIAIEAGQYGSDTGSIVVSIDGDTPVINDDDFSDVLYANIAAGTYTNKSKVTIATSAKRARVYSVEIKSGTYAPKPRIDVTSSNPMAVSNANDLHAITYTISNPSGASISASANVAWIHDFDYSVDGEVAFEVDAQVTDAAARSGVITLSYTGANSVAVTVNQAAGPSSGAAILQYTLTPTATGGNSAPHNSYTAAATVTIDGIGWSVMGNSSMVPWRIGGKNLSGVDRAIYSTTAIPANISQIVITHGAASSITVNSMTVYVCSTAAGAAADTPTNVVASFTPEFVADDDVTVNKVGDTSWANCFYRIVYNVSVTGNSNRFIAFSEAKFYGTN